MGTRQCSISLRARRVGLAALLIVVLTALAIPLSAAAATVNHTMQIPADLRDNPCEPGEKINFQATLHMVLHATADARGGYHMGIEHNWTGSGRSIVTGIEYRGSHTTERSAYVGSGETVTWIESMHFVSQGTDEDFLMHSTVHVRVTPTGVPTPAVENIRLECKG